MTTERSKSGMMLGKAGTSASLYAALWVIKLVDWILRTAGHNWPEQPLARGKNPEFFPGEPEGLNSGVFLYVSLRR